MEDKEIYGYIYLITNLINKKQYVGQTIISIKHRFWEHCNNAKTRKCFNMPITKAINKYKKENFIVEKLAVANNQNELNFLEGFYIKHFNTLSPNGYNLIEVIQGKGKHSEESINKMVKSANTKKRLQIAKENGKKSQGRLNLKSKIKYTGVLLIKNKYVSRITYNKKVIQVGTFCSEIDAAKAYDIQAIKLYGENCNLNFPELRQGYINNKIIVNKISRYSSKSGEKYINFNSQDNKWIYRWFSKTKNKNISKKFITLTNAINFKKNNKDI